MTTNKMREEFPAHTCAAIARGTIPGKEALAELACVARLNYDRARTLDREAIDQRNRIEQLEVECRLLKESLLAAEEQAATRRALPDGFVAVPVEPTWVMIEAGRWAEYGEESSRLVNVEDRAVREVYAAMLQAAPSGSRGEPK